MRVFCILLSCTISFVLQAQTVLVVQEGPGQVVLFRAHEPSHRSTIKVGDKPHEIELTPDGRTAYVSNFGLLEANHKVGVPGTTISVLDVERHLERRQFNLPAGLTAPHGLKLRPPHYTELFTNAEEGRGGMVVFDASSGVVLRTFSLPSGVHNFLFNADGSALFAFTMTGYICRIDPDSGTLIARVRTGSPRGLAWTADSHRLLASGNNEIVIVDPKHLSIESRMQNLGVGQIFYPTATPDGRWILAPAVLDGVVLIIEAATGTVVHRIPTGSPLLFSIASGGKQAWVANVLIPSNMLSPGAVPRDGGVTLLDLTTFKATPIPGIKDVNGLAVSSYD